MNLSRRDCLRAGALGGVAATLNGCLQITSHLASRPAFLPLPDHPTEPAARLLGRVTFGHRPGDIARLEQVGTTAFIESQLEANEPPDPRLTVLINRLETFELGSVDLEDYRKEKVIQQLQQASLLQAIYGTNGLHERMVDLWSDHFNVYALKGDSAFRKATDTVKVIRAHALGKFPDLLRASAHSPAMLGYLDNQINIKGRANENYARELMELHTLGVHGGYTQSDVQEVARCFTGWTIETRFLHKKGNFLFNESRHDPGSKVVLGHRIPAGGGQSDGERVLDILSAHPSTARFVASKLCRYFLGDAADEWIDPTAQTYLRTRGDLKEMLRPILNSRQILEGPPILKRPLDFVASAVRATGADTDGGTKIRTALDKMGQGAYQWPMPDGYPIRTSAWTGSMLPRWNFAIAFASNQLAGCRVPPEAFEEPFQTTHGRRAERRDHSLISQLARVKDEQRLALCLASPSFQWR